MEPKYNYKISKAEVKHILELYAQGMRVGDIAQQYGVHRMAISYHLRRAGVNHQHRKLGRRTETLCISLHPEQAEYVRKTYPNVSHLFSMFVQHLMNKDHARKD